MAPPPPALESEPALDDACYKEFSIDTLLRISVKVQKLEVRTNVLGARAEHTFKARVEQAVGSSGKREAFGRAYAAMAGYFVIPDTYPRALKEERETHYQCVMKSWGLDNSIIQRAHISTDAVCRFLALMQVLIQEV